MINMAEIKAGLNYLHIAPRKVRLVADLVRGMSVQRALLELENLPKRSAVVLLKLFKSAQANATHNFQIDEEKLYVKNIMINPGPVLKRFEPRAFGRASPVRKRSSHVLLILETKEVKTLPARKIKKEAPVVREMTEEDVSGMVEVFPRGGKDTGEAMSKPKTKGFVKRMFRRKAI